MVIEQEEQDITKSMMDGTLSMDIVLDRDATLPSYAHEHDAGMDLVASMDATLTAFTPQAVSTGIKIAIPVGYEGQVRPRSGLSLKGVTVYNAPGTIDSFFRGEVKVIIMYIPRSQYESTYEIKKGDRIAQLVISKCERIMLNLVSSLDETERGENGFGSSGV